MIWFVRTLIAVAAFFCAASAAHAQDILSPSQFRDVVIGRIQTAAPDAQIRVRDALGVDIHRSDDQDFQVNLDRGYDEYRLAPDRLGEVADKWARFVILPEHTRDPAAVVILLRPNEMVDAYNEMLSRGREPASLLSHPFAGDLQQVLAFDSAESLEYATEKSLTEAGLTVAQAWARAPANVNARLGAIEYDSSALAGITIVGGGNGIAPSLLTDPAFCTQERYAGALVLVNLRDGFVFAVPAERGALQTFRGFSDYIIRQGQSLSRTPLQCREGRLVTVPGIGSVQ